MQRNFQVIFAVGGEHVGLGFREDIQVVMVFLGNFGVEGGIRLEEGKKRRERTTEEEGRRGWEERWLRGCGRGVARKER